MTGAMLGGIGIIHSMTRTILGTTGCNWLHTGRNREKLEPCWGQLGSYRHHSGSSWAHAGADWDHTCSNWDCTNGDWE